MSSPKRLASINLLQAQTEQKGGGDTRFLSRLEPNHPFSPALIPVIGL